MARKREVRKTNRRRFIQGTGAAAVSVGLAGCSGDTNEGGGSTDDESTTPSTDTDSETEASDPSEIPQGGMFRFGMTEPVTGLNWITTSDMYTTLVLNLVNETGVIIDPYTNEMRPWVFEDWTEEVVDNGLDVHINVRDGLTWNDGTELTVDDVLFTYNFYLDQDPAEITDDVSPIESVEEADNDWDIYMRINETISVYDNLQLTFPILPEHTWGEVDDYSQYQPTDHLEEGRPVGLGPAVITRYEPDTSVEVEFRDPEEYVLGNLDWIQEHDQLRAGGPFLDGVRFNIYGSSSALNEAVLQGDVDTLYGSAGSGYFDGLDEASDVRFVQGNDSGWSHYSFNLRQEPLDCTCFRQALGFAFDEIYQIQQLIENRGYEGDFPSPPAYITARPDFEAGEDAITDHPAGDAFAFRQQQPGVVDVEGVRNWLRNGEIIDGSEGEYVGQEYPGSLTGVETSESEPRHTYTFDDVQSDVLQDEPVEQEIRVDGETIPEILGHPIRFLMSPPQDAPLGAQMIENYIGQLTSIGIPVQRELMTFNTRLTEAMQNANFEIFASGWTDQEPFGVQSLNSLFHSRAAHADPPGETLAPNAMGYGLEGNAGADEFIDQARTTLDREERNENVRMANERIYLDFPTLITSFDQPHWPVNSADYSGYLEDLTTPGASGNTSWMFRMIYQQG